MITATCEQCGGEWRCYREPPPKLCGGCVSEAAAAKPKRKPTKRKRKIPPMSCLDAHGCTSTHKTYAAFCQCRWPRSMSVMGEGQWGVYMEPDLHYQTGNRSRAVWPEIQLFTTPAEAADYYEALVRDEFRSVYLFSLPDDLSDTTYEDRTLAGIRAKHAVPPMAYGADPHHRSHES